MTLKKIVDLLHAEIFKLNGIHEKLKDVSTCMRLVGKKGNESLRKTGFRKLPASLEKTCITTVPNIYRVKVVEARKNQMVKCAGKANLQPRTHPKEPFKHSLKTAYILLPESRTQQRTFRDGLQ